MDPTSLSDCPIHFAKTNPVYDHKLYSLRYLMRFEAIESIYEQ